jgi:Carboxypeptidase regulatory-like domain
MCLRLTKFDYRAGVFALLLLLPPFLQAQLATVFFGTVTDAAGKPVSYAKVSAKNTQVGEPVEATTDSAGNYTLPALTPGPCTVSISAAGFARKESQVTCAGSGQQKFDVTLAAATDSQAVPNAPTPASRTPQQEPSLSDLGFTPQQAQADPKLQAELNKHTEMLKIHQRLGLITLAPMAATLITGPMAKAKGRNGQTITEPSNANLDFHAALGGTTAALYFTTASFAIFAPKVQHTPKHGAIRVHEALAFIHGPGMILTPILGAMAYQQEQDGEKVHGIASAHGPVAIATVCAYGASIIAVSWPIHLKFWEKQ